MQALGLSWSNVTVILSVKYKLIQVICVQFLPVFVVYRNIFYSLASAAEEKVLRTYSNSEDTDQSAHPRSLVRIFAVRLHNIGTLLKV